MSDCMDCTHYRRKTGVDAQACGDCRGEKPATTSLCHKCAKANVSCPAFPMDTQACVVYVEQRA